MKNVLVDTTITVYGSKIYQEDIPIKLHIKVLELNYGPVLDFEVTASMKFTNLVEWSDHPLMCSTEYMENNTVANIVEDTPVIRAMIEELSIGTKRKLHTTTDCTYKARLIKAIASFWS
jgi:hypothetical protein